MPTKPATDNWTRLGACHVCRALPGHPCVSLLDPREVMVRAHQQRPLAVERDDAGLLLLARRFPAGAPDRPVIHSYHVIASGLSACGGDLDPGDRRLTLPEVPRAELCARPACKRHWRMEWT